VFGIDRCSVYTG